MESKICQLCNNELPINEFNTSQGKSPDGYQCYCIKCTSLYNRIRNFYKMKGGMRMLRDNNSLPIFLPLRFNHETIKVEHIVDTTTEDDAISLLKSKGYKILKPTYKEI